MTIFFISLVTTSHDTSTRPDHPTVLSNAQRVRPEFVADVQGTVPANLRVMVESQATTPGIEIEIGHGILQQKRTHLGCGLLASVFRPAVIEVEFANHFR